MTPQTLAFVLVSAGLAMSGWGSAVTTTAHEAATPPMIERVTQ
jgi:hypothetical protein